MMTIASISDFPIDRQLRLYDDLTQIKGIGPARQQWLRASFHIRTFQDLAALTIDEIEAQLKAVGQIASRRHIDQWLVQAKQLLVAHDQTARQVAGSAESANTAAGTQPGKGDWKPFASFVVEFQTHTREGHIQEQRTKVHHIEGDTCAHWPGIETERLSWWMLEQMTEGILDTGAS